MSAAAAPISASARACIWPPTWRRRPEETTMTKRTQTTNLSRRKFIVSSAAAGGGLALGFNPFIESAEAATAAGTEINIWVAVRPDSSCVVRIARSEMGQGTLTGLAQLVAEELECDWKKITTEHINPGQNLARKRAWARWRPGAAAESALRRTMCVAAVPQRA